MQIEYELKRQIYDFICGHQNEPVKIINFINTKKRPELTDFFSSLVAQL
ncbi:hypothetical protein [Latilactobacillus fuchuensis]|nr:hypothetical protein [Latilactobacillus fuchuensis]